MTDKLFKRSQYGTDAAMPMSQPRANKALGQHFLFDTNVTRKIVRLAGDLTGAVIIEIGPGPGSLTKALLESSARLILAIEKDSRFLESLQGLEQESQGRLRLVEGDALKLNALSLVEEGAPVHIIANLPYNIGTALLIQWLQSDRLPRSMILMFQKEVAMRIVARPKTADYGRLSVLTQAIMEPTLVMTLPARAFTPPPKVDSAVVRFIPHNSQLDTARRLALETVTAAAFGQRRKMLRASLKGLGGETLCHKAGIAPDRRAETLDLQEFLRLAAIYQDEKTPATSS